MTCYLDQSCFLEPVLHFFPLVLPLVFRGVPVKSVENPPLKIRVNASREKALKNTVEQGDLMKEVEPGTESREA